MSASEAEQQFVERVSEYLVSLPFDLKILQEAVTDPDLDRATRLVAAGTVVHTLLPQEGEPGPLRYVDDVLYVRAAFELIGKSQGEGADEFRQRFDGEVYSRLAEDTKLFGDVLGDVWPWLQGRLAGFHKLTVKGKKPEQAIDDEEIATFLYDEGLEFATNYPVNDEQVRNKLRRVDQITDLLRKKYEEDKKKIG